jgi:hypothetical protein
MHICIFCKECLQEGRVNLTNEDNEQDVPIEERLGLVSVCTPLQPTSDVWVEGVLRSRQRQYAFHDAIVFFKTPWSIELGLSFSVPAWKPICCYLRSCRYKTSETHSGSVIYSGENHVHKGTFIS